MESVVSSVTYDNQQLWFYKNQIIKTLKFFPNVGIIQTFHKTEKFYNQP